MTIMSSGTPEGDRAKALQVLRQPFPPENIAKLPKVNCWDCTQAGRARKGDTCDRHTKAKCGECGNYITTGHIHLDYVGHAEATDRLLDADIEWSWEPMALTPDGLPLFDGLGGMWIRLTVAGVTRLGYGSAPGKTGPDAIKEVIGDAIRNSGMRFGLALDLWAKTDLHHDEPATDPIWLAAVRQRIDTAVDTAVLERIGADIGEQSAAGKVAEQDGSELRSLYDARWAHLVAEASQTPVTDEWSTPEPAAVGPKLSDGQSKLLHMLFGKLGIKDDQRYAYCADVLKRPVTTTSTLAPAEFQQVIDALQRDAEPAPTPLGDNERIELIEDLVEQIKAANSAESLGKVRALILEQHAAGRLTAVATNELQGRWTAREAALKTAATA